MRPPVIGTRFTQQRIFISAQGAGKAGAFAP
jgi:hypothetical protein